MNRLSPEQMQEPRDELDSKLAVAKPIAPDRTATPDEPRPSAPPEAAAATKPIWERILERTAAIPDEEYDKLPVDGAEQHDHNIYGTPKRHPAR
jgi:hypothetical protein